MNSLKRTLSLVLVLVMVLGLFGIASATSFSDDAKIQYNEAVDVMTGIGAINGMGDGTFNPTGTVTRAQAAKMVAYAVLGKSVADTLYGVNSSFSDVSYPAYDWAIPSIQYLVSIGAVAGRGDGTFDPNGEVTAYEIAKMLLVCLGIKGEYTGSSWTLDVAINATNAKLFAGRASNAGLLSAAATREECALYCFNAIIYSPSGTSSEKIWGVNGYEIVIVTITDEAGAETQVPVSQPTYGWIDVPVVATDSIAASVYPTLKTLTSAEFQDDLGRPATVWVYGSTAKVISYVPATPVATFTKGFSQHDLYKVLGVNGNVDTYVNTKGTQDDDAVLTSLKNTTGTSANAAILGNGVRTEIYKIGTGSSTANYIAVVIAPSFGKLTVATTKATSTHGAYNTYGITGDTVSGIEYTTIVDKDEDLDTVVIDGTVAKGDWVLYYQSEDTLYIEAVDTISGALSSITNTGVVTVGSTKTAKAAAFSTGPNGDLAISSAEGTYYVDSFGYILGVKESTGGINAVMLISVSEYNELVSGQIVKSYSAVIALPDGTVKTVATIEGVYADKATLVGKVYTNATNASGKYTFATAAAKTTSIDAITNGTAKLGTTSKYASGSTKFVFADYAYNSDGVRYATGTVTVYTGVSSVPTFSALSKATAVDYTTTSIADVVFIHDDVRATVSNANTYVLGTYTDTASGRIYDTIVNGEYDTVTIPAGATGDTLTGGKLYSSITINSSSVVAATEAVVAGTSIQNVSGLLFLNGNYASKSIASDVPVYTITKSSGALDVGTAADLATAVESGSIYVVYSSSNANAVAAVYILV